MASPFPPKNCLISLIVPFYNEAEAVGAFFARVVPVLENIPELDYEIICVNDGSCDATLNELLASSKTNPNIQILDLSRNFGKEAALTAGIDAAHGNAVIPMDADCQDPPEIIPLLVDKWRNGYEVVLARRSDRSTDTWAKRFSASMFYRVHNQITANAIPDNVGDYRLMDRCVVDVLKSLPERTRFMKGLFAWVGFKTTTVDYAREERLVGHTKFNGWRLWNFAVDGITSFSTLPLRIWTYIGASISFLALGYGAWIAIRTLIYGVDVPGYASLLTSILFLGGVQLVGIGVLGEYVGRIFIETKQRPIYVVRKRYRQDDIN